MVIKNNIKTFPYAQKAEEMEAWIRKFERELRDYIEFVDRAKRTHGLIEGEPIEIKYKIYKEILGEE